MVLQNVWSLNSGWTQRVVLALDANVDNNSDGTVELEVLLNVAYVVTPLVKSPMVSSWLLLLSNKTVASATTL